MTETAFTRRSALKMIGAAGLLGAVGNTVEATSSLSSVRFIEAGVEYTMERDHNFHTFGLDGRSLYDIPDSGGRIRLQSPVNYALEKLFVQSNVVVGGVRITNSPGIVSTSDPSPVLTTSLTGDYRPLSEIHLTQQHRPPTVEVRSPGGQPKIVIDGEETVLSPGSEQIFELEAETINVETITVSNERVKNEDVPVQERGLKTEYGSVAVEARPAVKVRDHGELSVEIR